MLAILGPLAALVGLEVDTLKDRFQRQAMLWGILGALGIVSVSFILVAINSALTYAVGPVIAPLIIAGAALIIAITVYLIFSFRDSIEKQKEAEKKHNAEMTALITTAAITAIPLILPTLKKVGLPAGGAAAAVYSLLQAKALRRDH
jgi:predicted tellurium resistance membrane protein TerC